MSKGMKNSGIPWIGKIPSHWEVIPFKKAVSTVSTGLNPRDNFVLSKDAPLFYVTIKNFKDGKLYLDDNCDRIDDNAWRIIQKRSCLQKGDILFASISKDAQCYILQDFPRKWNINESVFALRGNKHVITDKFLYYSLVNPEYYKGLRIGATGTTFQSIKQNKLKESSFVCPPFTEQQYIADFLDEKCAEIDEAISLQEKIIGELKAYMQSVITESVCNGLNPDTPMKDSEIEWIGQIPKEWVVCRIKDILEEGKDGIRIGPFGSALTNKVEEEGVGKYKIYGQWNIVDRDFNAGKNYITAQTYNELYSYRIVAGDVLVSLMGTIGKCAVIPDNIQEGIMDSHVIKIRLNGRIQKKYFEYIYDKDNSTFVFEQIQRMKKGSIMDGLNSSIVKSLYLLLPPLEEQQAIADYLDEKCKDIDALISVRQSKIEALKEYKKSIIYEYVTGKKEVK